MMKNIQYIYQILTVIIHSMIGMHSSQLIGMSDNSNGNVHRWLVVSSSRCRSGSRMCWMCRLGMETGIGSIALGLIISSCNRKCLHRIGNFRLHFNKLCSYDGISSISLLLLGSMV